MSKYQVWFTKSIHVLVIVDAETDEEVEKKGFEKFNSLTEEEMHTDPDVGVQTSSYELAYIVKDEEE